jgi:hypothetical protein
MDTVCYTNSHARENLSWLGNEPENKVLTGCRDGSIAVDESIGSAIGEVSGGIRSIITPHMLLEIVAMPQVRREKFLGILKQFACGTYDLDERLDVVLGRLLKDIAA